MDALAPAVPIATADIAGQIRNLETDLKVIEDGVLAGMARARQLSREAQKISTDIAALDDEVRALAHAAKSMRTSLLLMNDYLDRVERQRKAAAT